MHKVSLNHIHSIMNPVPTLDEKEEETKTETICLHSLISFTNTHNALVFKMVNYFIFYLKSAK